MTQYSEVFLDLVWAQTTRPLGAFNAAYHHPSDARIDELGNIVCRSHYGKATSAYGWEVDHRHPSALGGAHHVANLRALACSANRGLGGLIRNALR
jgi:hypothetical protein